MKPLSLAAATALLLAFPTQAHAQPLPASPAGVPSAAPPPPAAPTVAPTVTPHPPVAPHATRALRYDLRVDLPVTAVAAAAWLGTELLKGPLTSLECRWCDRDARGADALNPLDAATRNALRWSDTGAAGTLSNLTGFVLVPLMALGTMTLAAHDHDLANVPLDGLLVAEAAAIAMTLNQAAKLVFERERPFLHFASADARGALGQDADSRLSFFSGHATLAFSVAVASGTVASLRGYRWAPLVWATGLTLATATGYLRIAADKHYLTDVLVGAAVGSAVGFLVPWLFHRPLARHAPALPVIYPATVPGGATVNAMLLW